MTYALDLGVVVPACLLSAYWLRRDEPWGFVLAAITLVKGMTVGLSFVAMTAAVTSLGSPLDLVQLLVWAVMGLVSLGMLVWLLCPLRNAGRAQHPRRGERRTVSGRGEDGVLVSRTFRLTR